jgi:adenylate cyclase
VTALLWLALGVCAALALALVRVQRRANRLGEARDDAAGELERLSGAFARFAPHAVVEEIIARGVSTQGERKEVTVLFADLVGFTPVTERVDPSVLVRILNGYFERMSRAITEHQGHLSTLIGDGILALFGAVESNPWQSNDAARAALAMRDALADYSRELIADGLPPLAIGIGLHRGVGVAGLVGSKDLVQFTVVGSVVNVAARVQELTRTHAVEVLVTGPVRAALDPRFELRPLPPANVRGIAAPVEIFALAGFRAGDG